MNRSIKKIRGFSFLLIVFFFVLSQSALGETQFTVEGDLNSLLYTAVKDGKNLLAIETLIKNGADVNAKNDQGYTALHAAAHYSTAAIVKALLEAGADVNAKSQQGYIPLHVLAYNMNEKNAKEIAGVLLEVGESSKIMNLRSYYWSTPLHLAARYGTLALVETLIEAGVDVSAKDLKGYTPLHLAAEGNTEAVVEVILKANANANVKANNGQTPLHLAAASNARTAVLKVLLEAEADINTKDKNNRTPLHLAAASNTNTEVLKILFSASKTSRNAKDVEGYTPFYRAVADNANAAVIEFFIQNGANAKASIKYGLTALHVAALHNKEPDIMRTLIRAGANVNAKVQEEGWTALHIAARHNTVSVVETLIQNGADVNVRGNFVGISKRDWEDRTIYPSGTQGLTPLHWAAENDTTTASDIVKVLIKAGADVNAETKEGKNPRTPLALAVCYNTKTFLGIVEVLLKSGANMNELIKTCIGVSDFRKRFEEKGKQYVEELKDWERLGGLRILPIPEEWASFSWPDVEERFRGHMVSYLIFQGWTPSRWVRKYTPERRLAILKIFLQYADNNINVGLSKGDITNILHIAVRDNGTTGDFVKLLIRKGANINSKNKDGKTLLHMAAHYNKVDVVRVLLEARANINTRDANEQTPLREAARYNTVDVVIALLEAGANVNTRDKNEETPLHEAAHYNTADVVKVLLEAGADLKVKNKNGFIPLVSAINNKRDALAIVEIFIKEGADVNAIYNSSANESLAGYGIKLFPDEFTVLHMAAQSSTGAVVRALLKAGADVDARNTHGRTPLHDVAAVNNEETASDIVRALIESEADVNVRDNNGRTPLHLAVNRGVVKILLKAGADVRARDKKGWLPLHEAVSHCRKGIIVDLIQNGADIDEVVKKGDGENESPRETAQNVDCSWE